jgi:uncharacterized caspase-like protein
VSGPTARDVGDDDLPARLTRPVGTRWAVIVGISDYVDDRLELQYAHADAEAMRDFLLTPAGGAYSEERIKLLMDRDASRDAVTRAIRSFLGQTAEDDLALLFFACHGTADASGFGKPLYLLTADTDYDDIAGTALPMVEIDWGLRNYVRAKRVVILADTCHSAGIRSGARGDGDLSAGALNTYLDRLGDSKPGVAYLTSAREEQRSFEDAKWGGGHGAFTHFLLEGLSGAADGYGGRPRDNVVTLAELAGYVQDRVFKATEMRQEPNLGEGSFDRELPLAVVGGLDVEAKLQLARALIEVGWLLDDPAPFLCADREARDALHLASLTNAELPGAAALSGEALLAAGEHGQAAATLQSACERHGDELPATAWLHLGLARAGLGESDQAPTGLEAYAQRAPDDPEAGWAMDYASWLRASSGRTRALLIGIGTYELGVAMNLQGPPHDVVLLRDLLTRDVGVAPEDVTTLLDEQATVAHIQEALEHLAAVSDEGDVALVYFSGHGAADAVGDSPYLIAHDADGDQPRGLSAARLHELIARIPARARLVILDTHGSEAFNTLAAEHPIATVIAASAPGAMAYDDNTGETAHGAFTAALAAAWRAAPDPREVTWQALCAGAAERLHGRFDQVPVLIGAPVGGILQGAFPAAGFWHESRARSDRPPAWSDPGTAAKHQWPRQALVAARASIAIGSHDEALAALEAWTAKYPDDAWPWVDAARAAVAAARPERAVAALERFAQVAARARWNATPGEALKAVDALQRARGRALLVGVGRQADTDVPPARGAAADVAAMRKALLERGFDEADITVLVDADATREAIMSELVELVGSAKDELAVCFIAANGSRSGGEPSVVPYDGRGGGANDVTLKELAELGGPDLVTIIDAGLGHAVAKPRTRSVEPAVPHAPTSRDISGVAPPEELPEVSGVMVLVPPGPAGVPPPVRERRSAGVVTKRLLDALDGTGLTYERWAGAATTDDLPVWAIGTQAAWPALRPHTRLAATQGALDALARAPAQAAIELAQQETVRSRERDEPCPAAWLELGLAHAAAGAPREAIRHLRNARNLYDNDDVRKAEAQRDERMELWRREARYHVGRLLYEHPENPSDYADAVAALEPASLEAPDDPRIMLHFGLAIRAQAERQNLVEATRLLRAYVAAGAPLGRLDEVRAYLESTATGASGWGS